MPSKTGLAAILYRKSQACPGIGTWPAWTECRRSTTTTVLPHPKIGCTSQFWFFLANKDATGHIMDECCHLQESYNAIEVWLRIYQVLISSVVLKFKLLAVEKKLLLFVTFQVRRCGSRFVRWNQISGCATRFQVSGSSLQELDSLQKTLDLPHLLRNAAAGEKSALRKISIQLWCNCLLEHESYWYISHLSHAPCKTSTPKYT